MSITNRLISGENWKDIIQSIYTQRITIINAPTGTGKTLGVPAAYCSKAFIEGKRDILMFVVLPTTLSVQLAYQAQYALQEKMGQYAVQVGYVAQHEYENYDNANILYVTSDYFLKKMMNWISGNKGQRESLANAVMLDEIHVGSLSYQIIMSLWQALLSNEWLMVMNTSLILSSATVDKKLFAPLYELNRNISTFNLIPPTTNVKIEWAGDIEGSLHSLTRYTQMAKAVWVWHQHVTLEGNFLVFLPGKGQIKHVHKILDQMIKVSTIEPPIIIDVFGGMPIESRKQLMISTTGRRRIMLATNIAETSITIPGVTVIFDSMVENVAYAHNTSGIRLSKKYISQSSATQRAGRAGRTNQNGVCIRMCSQATFNSLDITREEESLRVPLHRTIVDFIDKRIGSKLNINRIYNNQLLMNTVKSDVRQIATLMLVSSDWSQTVKNISSAVSTLYRRGIISYDQNSFKTSQLGHFVTLFDLSIDNITILWHLLARGDQKLYYPMIALVCLIDSYDNRGFFAPPSDTNQNDYKHNYRQSFGGDNDIHVLLNIWRQWMLKWAAKKPERYKQYMNRWSQENHINNFKMVEVWNQIKNVRFNLIRYNSSSNNKSVWPDFEVEYNVWTENDNIRLLVLLKDVLLKFFPDRVCQWSGRRTEYFDALNRKYYANTDKSIVQYDKQPNVIISLLDIQTSFKGRLVNNISLGFAYHEANPNKLPINVKTVDGNQSKSNEMLALFTGVTTPSSKENVSTVPFNSGNSTHVGQTTKTEQPVNITVNELDGEQAPDFLFEEEFIWDENAAVMDNVAISNQIAAANYGPAQEIALESIQPQNPQPVMTNEEVINDTDEYQSRIQSDSSSIGLSSIGLSSNESNVLVTIYNNEEVNKGLATATKNLKTIDAKVEIKVLFSAVYKLLKWRERVLSMTKSKGIYLDKPKWYNMFARTVIDMKSHSKKDMWNKLLSEYDRQIQGTQRNRARSVLIDSWSSVDKETVPQLINVDVRDNELRLGSYSIPMNPSNISFLRQKAPNAEALVRLFLRYILLVPYDKFWYHNPNLIEYLTEYFDQVNVRYGTPLTHDVEQTTYQSLFKTDSDFGTRVPSKQVFGVEMTLNIVPRTENMVSQAISSMNNSKHVNLWLLPHWGKMKNFNSLNGVIMSDVLMMNLNGQIILNNEPYFVMWSGDLHEATKKDHMKNITELLQQGSIKALNPVFGQNFISISSSNDKSRYMNATSPRRLNNTSVINLATSPRSATSFRSVASPIINVFTQTNPWPTGEIILPQNYLSPSLYREIPTRTLITISM